MNKLISSINITIDGFCGHKDVIRDDEHHEFINDLMERVDTVLLGRITYQLFEAYWPNAAKDATLSKSIFRFAQLIDKLKKSSFQRT